MASEAFSDTLAAGLGEWRPVDPTTGAQWFSGFSVQWWIAGGWALDIHLGEPSRQHDALDVGVLRTTIRTVISALPAWEFFEAKGGILTELRPPRLPASDVHALWCRRSGSRHWEVELMLENSSGDEWVY